MDQLLPHFRLNLVNGMQGDPAVYGFSPKTGDALLFDLGTVDNLTHKDLLRVRLAMVTHAHVDHFIGFDRWLRVNIPHRRSLELCGPRDFHRNVLGKLNGYTWNLIDVGQLQFIIHEVDDHGDTTHMRITNSGNNNGFKVESFTPAVMDNTLPVIAKPGALLTVLPNQAGIYAVALDHGTSSLAYCCHIPGSQHVKAENLPALKLKPGPWIKDLQTRVANNSIDGEMVVDGQKLAVTDLVAQLIVPLPSQTLTYLTDICFSRANLQRLKTIADKSTLLICEANFRDEDFTKAFAKKHLTTRQAALIAAYINADNLEIFHVSNIYPDQADISAKEAGDFFATFNHLDADDLDAEIGKELARVSD